VQRSRLPHLSALRVAPTWGSSCEKTNNVIRRLTDQGAKTRNEQLLCFLCASYDFVPPRGMKCFLLTQGLFHSFVMMSASSRSDLFGIAQALVLRASVSFQEIADPDGSGSTPLGEVSISPRSELLGTIVQLRIDFPDKVCFSRKRGRQVVDFSAQLKEVRCPMPEEIPEKTRQLFLIFRDAVQREREAQITYKRAAELCEDEELKGVLLGFYRDEVRHEEALVEQYERIRDRYSVQAE